MAGPPPKPPSSPPPPPTVKPVARVNIVPWDEAMASPAIPEIDRAINKAIVDKVFSGASCIATVRGLPFHRVRYGQSQMPPPLRKLAPRALFDVGSLTRVLATHAAVVYLAGKGRMDITASIGSVLKDFAPGPLGAIPIDTILDHTSGIPHQAPLYEGVEAADKRVAVKERRLGTLKALPDMRAIVATQIKPVHKPGTSVLPSDLAYLVLGWIIEAVTAKPLDVFLATELYKPLDMDHLMRYMPMPPPKGPQPRRDFVSTEDCKWRKKLITGEVEDHNAWAMGGVAGHAGLFATAEAVHRLAQAMLDSVQGRSRMFHAGTLKRHWTRSKRVADMSRAFGWDTPGRDNGMLNIRMSNAAIGEVSSNGSALWIDPVQNVVAVFLVNGSHPTLEGKQEALAKLRLRYFDLVHSYAGSAQPEKIAGSNKVAALIDKLKKRK